MTAKSLLTGRSYGRLTVAREGGRTASGSVIWECTCVCGGTARATGRDLASGHTASCGCLQSEKAGAMRRTHGLSGAHIFRVWHWMKDRCLNTKNKNWPRYGGRGILVCSEWMDFENFMRDMGPSFPGTGWTIERKNNDGNYQPGNCIWATRKTQMRNTCRSVRIAHNEQTKTMIEWSSELNVPYQRIKSRILAGWPAEAALTAPAYARKP